MIDDGLEHNPGISRRALAALHEGAFGWALSLTRYDAQAAEDVMQQAYLTLVEGKARFDGDASLKTWLYAVIRNSARRYQRRRWLEARHMVQMGDDEFIDTNVDDAAAAADGEQVPPPALRQAVESLPDRQRQVLELVIDAELTLKESARVMGISVGSARTHYHRAKQTLRRQLERSDDY
jgi:RNA polymerase sigma-70 factor (ECF subfamily)